MPFLLVYALKESTKGKSRSWKLQSFLGVDW